MAQQTNQNINLSGNLSGTLLNSNIHNNTSIKKKEGLSVLSPKTKKDLQNLQNLKNLHQNLLNLQNKNDSLSNSKRSITNKVKTQNQIQKQNSVNNISNLNNFNNNMNNTLSLNKSYVNKRVSNMSNIEISDTEDDPRDIEHEIDMNICNKMKKRDIDYMKNNGYTNNKNLLISGDNNVSQNKSLSVYSSPKYKISSNQNNNVNNDSFMNSAKESKEIKNNYIENLNLTTKYKKINPASLHLTNLNNLNNITGINTNYIHQVTNSKKISHNKDSDLSLITNITNINNITTNNLNNITPPITKSEKVDLDIQILEKSSDNLLFLQINDIGYNSTKDMSFTKKEVTNINNQINYNNIITSKISDELFFKDKRYILMQEKINEVKEESNKIKETERELKMVIEIMKSCVKIQEVFYIY